MDEKRRIELAIALTEFEIEAVSDFAEDYGQNLEEYLADAAEEKARNIAYVAEFEDELLSREEIEEFTNNYHNDREIDFLRDARKHGDE